MHPDLRSYSGNIIAPSAKYNKFSYYQNQLYFADRYFIHTEASLYDLFYLTPILAHRCLGVRNFYNTYNGNSSRKGVRMKRIKNILPKQTGSSNSLARPNGSFCALRYNNPEQEDMELMKKGFAARLSSLRLAKGVSAREMSLSLGQGAGYINNIENGRNLPSMQQFFAICEYLQISPAAYFEYASTEDEHMKRLLLAVRPLPSHTLQLLCSLAETLSGQ